MHTRHNRGGRQVSKKMLSHPFFKGFVGCYYNCFCIYPPYIESTLNTEPVNSLLTAHEAGHFTAEIAPIEVKAKKGKASMSHDEHPRPQTTLEQMAKLPTVFKKGGTVTAANASVRWFNTIF